MGRIRVLRILEYVGERESVERAIRQRVVKEEAGDSSFCRIREAFVGGILGYEPIEEGKDDD